MSEPTDPKAHNIKPLFVITIVCRTLLSVFVYYRYHMKNLKVTNKLGQLLKELRIAKGMSQEQLADYSRVHRTYIGMVERGEKNITIVSLSRITKGLGISLSDLMKQLENVDK